MTYADDSNKENVKVFDLSGKLIKTQDRNEFYKEIRKEYKKSKKVSKQVRTVRLFLMNSNGGIYITRRSKLKSENRLLYDKTIGAHIREDESPEYTVLRECAEELGFPAAVLTETEFMSAIAETDLRIVGVFTEVDAINAFPSKYKYNDGSSSIFPQITSIFIGVFDGPIKFKDGETSGIEIYYPDEILEELEKYPEKYTEDMKVLIPKYLPKIKQIVKQLKSVNGS